MTEPLFVVSRIQRVIWSIQEINVALIEEMLDPVKKWEHTIYDTNAHNFPSTWTMFHYHPWPECGDSLQLMCCTRSPGVLWVILTCGWSFFQCFAFAGDCMGSSSLHSKRKRITSHGITIQLDIASHAANPFHRIKESWSHSLGWKGP